MKKTAVLSILLVAILAFNGCMKENCGYDPEANQPVLFQYEYINYAWGYRHHGFLIDSDGNIKGFLQPEKWIFPDSTGMLKKVDLEYNLAQCDTSFGKVDRDVLHENFNKLGDIREGKIMDNGIVMADAGTGVLSGWYWNAKAGKYESVFLISNGDYSRVNTHSSVKDMVEWLKSVGEKTDRFYWYGDK
jgi:hypothetical protein